MDTMIDLRQPYLTRHLIAYIGNKRSLLGFLSDVFTSTLDRGGPGRRPAVFLDPFAGSGAVARLARALGFRVLANDWELYSWVLNTAHLGVEAREAGSLFRELGGPERVFEELNRLPPPPQERWYIARHYAPRDTARADYRRERLFYTAENARTIDAVRHRIEELLPGFDLPAGARKEKAMLLASLLYQCATHTNTSGVFKACHKGFGGHGKDALKRILAPVHLEIPVLIDAAFPAEVFRLEAAEFVRGRVGDLCYLDPPYNQHQYGSNYHLLNTIARWDRPPVDERRRPDGTLAAKAAIPPDWVRTRSAYCYRETAPGAFRELLEAIDCRHVLLSYNTEGIVPFEELVDLLDRQGRVEIFSSDYVKYRGGKQSIQRQVHNLELLLAVDRTGRPGGGGRERVGDLLARRKLDLLLRRSYRPAEVRRRFETEGQALVLADRVRLPMPHLYRFDGGNGADPLPRELDGLSAAGLQELAGRLPLCQCRDLGEEIEVLLEILESERDPGRRRVWSRRVLYLLRKFAFRKYRLRFTETLGRLRRLAAEQPERYGLVGQGLDPLERLARARFEG